MGYSPSDSKESDRTEQLILTILNSHLVKNPPAKQETREMQVQYLGWEDPLEEEMATHSNIPTWKISWDRGD